MMIMMTTMTMMIFNELDLALCLELYCAYEIGYLGFL